MWLKEPAATPGGASGDDAAAARSSAASVGVIRAIGGRRGGLWRPMRASDDAPRMPRVTDNGRGRGATRGGSVVSLDARDASLDRDRHGLRALRDAELLEDARDVVLHRAAGDPELAGDLRVRRALHDERQHLLLPRSELLAREALREPHGDLGGPRTAPPRPA